MSRSQVDKLGDRIRKSATISDSDRDALLAYINEHSDAEQAVAERLREGIAPHLGRAMAKRLRQRGDTSERRATAWIIDHLADRLAAREPEPLLPLSPTSRAKTADTTIEKLRREKSRLSTIADIAGVRVVLEHGGWIHQDAVVAAIEELYPRARRKDRREDPSSGYRAVHVIVTAYGRLVEVQVRTKLQDAWAQLFERLADDFGRQIRYGDPPDDPSDKTLVEQVIAFAASIERLEQSQARCQLLREVLPLVRGGPLRSLLVGPAVSSREEELRRTEQGIGDLRDAISRQLQVTLTMWDRSRNG